MISLRAFAALTGFRCILRSGSFKSVRACASGSAHGAWQIVAVGGGKGGVYR